MSVLLTAGLCGSPRAVSFGAPSARLCLGAGREDLSPCFLPLPAPPVVALGVTCDPGWPSPSDAAPTRADLVPPKDLDTRAWREQAKGTLVWWGSGVHRNAALSAAPPPSGGEARLGMQWGRDLLAFRELDSCCPGLWATTPVLRI